MTDHKSPVEQALDLFVFAPIGLALTAAEELPKLAEKGRDRFAGRSAMYRVVGQFAVNEGQRQAEKFVRDATDRLNGTAASPAPPPASPRPAAGDTTPTEPVAPVATPASNGTAPSSDDLAIPGYDALSASQVVQRLAGLAPAELEAVGAYEAATRGRKTILNRVAQLQAAG